MISRERQEERQSSLFVPVCVCRYSQNVSSLMKQLYERGRHTHTSHMSLEAAMSKKNKNGSDDTTKTKTIELLAKERNSGLRGQE